MDETSLLERVAALESDNADTSITLAILGLIVKGLIETSKDPAALRASVRVFVEEALLQGADAAFDAGHPPELLANVRSRYMQRLESLI